jgi:polyribonucleotide nucleotidyltransferase
MLVHRVERQIGQSVLSIETGKVAKQAGGAAVLRYGDTVVLVAATRDKAREGIDFFPLTVDYREKTYAAGKFPGGFFKREGRPSTKEILTMRMVDRPIRPLFPEGYRDEVQILSAVLSADRQNEPDILTVVGASAALGLSGIPFEGPIGAVRVGRVDGQFVINPTVAQTAAADLNLVVCGTDEAVVMIEGEAKEVEESVIAEAIRLGQEAVRQVIALQRELFAVAAKPVLWTPPPRNEALRQEVTARVAPKLREAMRQPTKEGRRDAVTAVREALFAELCPPDAAEPAVDPAELQALYQAIEEQVARALILEGRRLDGRGPKDLRPIASEVGILPRTHGSALFTRGETQALGVATLGTVSDQQKIDGLLDEYMQRFMLHYNFPPFSVGECRPIRGPSRREIGHGALAERALISILPDEQTFPYTIRIVADILESNGSSSMASVCAGTLSLMDAGVPIHRPVAGISIGMVSEGDRYVLLTDIMGEEDHYGDMDFKVAGTQRGVTAMQVDLKVKGLPHDRVVEALAQAREARIEILRQMLAVIDRPRGSLSAYAPRLARLTIPQEKIGALIGPGGRNVRGIEEATGATVEIEDDGTVTISAPTTEALESARAEVEKLTLVIEVGKVYHGKVVSIKDFGAFVELAPGTDGMVHISELDAGYVKKVNDVVNMGDEIDVKVISIDDTGRIKLSRKALLPGGDSGGDRPRRGRQQGE